jgi:glutathione S-transferase
MIELYQFEDCRFCKQVRRKLEDLNLDWISHSAKKGAPQRRTLRQLGGKEQVPFLVDIENDIKMYESEDIIDYLEETYGDKN